MAPVTGAELEFRGRASVRRRFPQVFLFAAAASAIPVALQYFRSIEQLAPKIAKDESVARIVKPCAHRAPNCCVCLTKAERKRPKACVRVLTFACWLLAAAVDSRTFVLLRYVTKRVGES